MSTSAVIDRAMQRMESLRDQLRDYETLMRHIQGCFQEMLDHFEDRPRVDALIDKVRKAGQLSDTSLTDALRLFSPEPQEVS